VWGRNEVVISQSEDATLSSLAAMMNALGVIPKNDFKNHLILER
jgi:hypothetical protein